MTNPLCFRPAWGLGNRHVQTIWPAVIRRRIFQSVHREVWTGPDGHAVDLVLLPERPAQPGVLLLHGLEGSYASSYIQGMLLALARAGYNGAVLEFRSCGPTEPQVPELYHSGKTDEIAFAVKQLQSRWGGAPVAACGFSLGGNALIKWMGETGASCPLAAAVAISVPFDLAACARCLDGPGVLAWVYRERFLRSLKRKACRTARRHKLSFTDKQVMACKTLHAFDDLVTAPLFGFASAEDYWQRNSSRWFLPDVARPTLLVNAADDPFVPASCWPAEAVANNQNLSQRFTQTGGHTGFVAGSMIRPRYEAEAWAMQHFAQWL